MNPNRKTLKGENCTKPKGDCPNQVHSGQMVLGTVSREAGPCERWPKALKTKLAQGGNQA
jgi:hypothetical protein